MVRGSLRWRRWTFEDGTADVSWPSASAVPSGAQESLLARLARVSYQVAGVSSAAHKVIFSRIVSMPVLFFTATLDRWSGEFAILNPGSAYEDVVTTSLVPVDADRYEHWRPLELERRRVAHDLAVSQRPIEHAATQARATEEWRLQEARSLQAWQYSETQRKAKVARARLISRIAIGGFGLLLVPIVGSTVIGGESLASCLAAGSVFWVPLLGLLAYALRSWMKNRVPTLSQATAEPVVPFIPVPPLSVPPEYAQLPFGCQV